MTSQAGFRDWPAMFYATAHGDPSPSSQGDPASDACFCPYVQDLPGVNATNAGNDSTWLKTQITCEFDVDCDAYIDDCAHKRGPFANCPEATTTCCQGIGQTGMESFRFCHFPKGQKTTDTTGRRCWFSNPGTCMGPGTWCARMLSADLTANCTADSDCGNVCQGVEGCSGVCVTNASKTDGSKICAMKQQRGNFNGVDNPQCCGGAVCSGSTESGWACTT